ncbi:MAG: hypothetical protein CMJ27_02945 [Phycisphaerae bacterium]|nr:hypothetical protein [Phycisphaerae bacterium]
MSRSTTPTTRAESHDWRSRVAAIAADDVGRTHDPETLTEARRLVDRGVLGASVAFTALGLAGAIAGWAAAGELLDPAESRVHAPAMLAIIVGVPWFLFLARALVLVAFRRRVTPWLGRLVPAGLIRFIGGGHETLTRAVARRMGEMLAIGAGRPLAAAGTGTFWTIYALTAILAIWFATARVAFGFGWESSWLPPEVGEAVVDIAAAPIELIVDLPDLEPVAAPPLAPADDPAALLVRRTWITFLSIGITAYLLIPMLAWTIVSATIGHRRANRWHPPGTTAITTRRTPIQPTPATTTDPPNPEAAGCTHLIRVERPADAAPLPDALAGLVDLGDDDASDRTSVAGEAPGRLVIVAWAAATPDRGIHRRLSRLLEMSSESPLLILDGGNRLRRGESPTSVAIRLEDWRRLAEALDVERLECDLEELTGRSGTLLKHAIAGTPMNPGSDETSAPELRLAELDGAFAIIGRHLEGEAPLPADAAMARCLTELAAEVGRRDDDGHWRDRLAGLVDLDAASVPERLAALRAVGLGQLPAGLRSKAIWIGTGGLLGVAACAAAAVVAPAALLAMPAWAGTGAGIAGLVSLARRGDGAADPSMTTDPSNPTDLGAAVLALAATAALWWSQGCDESRTTTILETLAPDEAAPVLADADEARRWLAAARAGIADRMESIS